MQGPQAPKPFTRMISTILMAVVALYLVINIGVLSTCASIGSCAFLQSLPSFDFIPGVRQTVIYLMMCVGRDQAALAQKILSFTWFTGLIALAAMIALAAVLSLRTSKEERDQTRRLIMTERANAAPAVPILTKEVVVGAVSLVLSLYVLSGFRSSQDPGTADSSFIFQGISLDLFFMIIAWSGLLFMSIFYIRDTIEGFLLPPSRRSQS